MQHLFGFGKIYIYPAGYEGNLNGFEKQISTLTFDPQGTKDESVNNTLLRVFEGWRVSIDATITLTTDAEVEELKTILDNASIAPDWPTFGVVPHYAGPGAANRVYYPMLLDSTISLAKVFKYECGQRLKIKFISRDLLQTLPTDVNYPGRFLVTDAGGNNLADIDGNIIW